jgi:hypothetical protein
LPIDQTKRNAVAAIFEGFLRNRVVTIRRLTMADLGINPFLIRLLANEMHLRDAGAIVHWLVAQRLERGTVTSFGIALQQAAKVFSEGTGVEGADILKTKDGRHYHIQVKSGPNTVPKDMAVRITELLQAAQRRNRGSVGLFGMCYGSPEQVSGIVKKYIGVDPLVGREFWEFISDDPGCIGEIYAIAGHVGRTFRDTSGQSLSEVLEHKIADLEMEFRTLYGENDSQMWDNLLTRNS